MAPIEQVKLKRAGLGLRGLDEGRACPGFTLFCTTTGDGTVYLIDLRGEVVHTWRMPYRPGNSGYLTERGTLFYNGKLPEESNRFLARQPWKGGVVLEADWAGNVRWELRHPDHHHDAIRLRNGNVLLLCLGVVPPDIAARVQGGLPGTEDAGVMYGDYLVEMTLDGRVIWEWRSWEHLDPEIDRLGAAELRYEWTHGNAVAELPSGDLVASFRSISTVVVVERETGRIAWRLGPPTLAQQHAPTPLPNGNLLIFDNGAYRVDSNVAFSRVLEVEMASKAIVWSYRERRPMDFYSPLVSNAQRLPNGNTLICEGSFGRLFEVTADGEVVWEYVNPFFYARPDEGDGAPLNAVFRAYRYAPDEIERARATAAGR